MTGPLEAARQHRHIDDILYVAGRSPVENQTQYDIMFIAAAVDEDEATQHSVTTFGYRINQPAEYLKGATGIIKDVALRAGVDIDRCYYTSVCKWLLPRMKRAKPPVKILKWGLPILMDEIKRTKPKIIVCLGKQAFDLLSDRKIGFDDAHGGWFWSTEAQAHLYLMYAPYSLVGKPELYETFRVDFMEIARKKKLLDGEDIQDIPVRYDVIRDEQSLRDWVARMEELYDDRIPGVMNWALFAEMYRLRILCCAD
jgi:uracil-DNA glycosylase family 4